VDDHPLLREGIVALINAEKDFTVCSQIGDAKKILPAIQATKPEVVVLDITLNNDISGLEVLKDIRAQFPNTKVLMLSMHEESVYAHRALRSGAFGYLMKQEAPETVLAALRKIVAGEVYLSQKLGERLLQSLAGKANASISASPIDILSDRELEVFGLLGKGHGTRHIAEQLSLSIKTIESHRAHIKEKLNVGSAAELVHQAIQWTQTESAGSLSAMPASA
jgi:DNA-binding NarL/FixJ family response regulator